MSTQNERESRWDTVTPTQCSKWHFLSLLAFRVHPHSDGRPRPSEESSKPSKSHIDVEDVDPHRPLELIVIPWGVKLCNSTI